MSTLPITVPLFTEKDERKERDELSSTEREEIQADLRGENVEDETESEGEKLRGLEELEEALKGIPDREKASYTEALRNCPALVATETAPLRFLRNSNYNPSDAAAHLARFWKRRVELFKDKAFLPCALSGPSCLSPEAIAFVEAGAFCQIPNDAQGRAVVFYNRTLTEALKPSVAAFVQTVVYFALAVSETESAQRNGIVLVVYGKPSNKVGFDHKLLRKGLNFVCDDCMPWRIKAAHVCIGFAKPRYNLFMMVVKRMASRYLRLRMQVHYGASKGELLQELELFGFKSTTLPTELNGQWKSQEKHGPWLEMRRSMATRGVGQSCTTVPGS